MRGAVAAGHPLTAEAGARALRAGGNAVDACVGAALASWVTESPLTGPGAGGFMLVHRAHDRTDRLLDFFVAAPGLGRERRRRGEMEAIDVAFDSESSQLFRIGAASCAVPGAAAGLEAALALARDGVALTNAQAYLHRILDLILRHTDEGRRVYGPDRPLTAGEPLVLGDLGTTLEVLARGGAAALYGGPLGRELV